MFVVYEQLGVHRRVLWIGRRWVRWHRQKRTSIADGRRRLKESFEPILVSDLHDMPTGRGIRRSSHCRKVDRPSSIGFDFNDAVAYRQNLRVDCPTLRHAFIPCGGPWRVDCVHTLQSHLGFDLDRSSSWSIWEPNQLAFGFAETA